jgi:hypothetical protein
MNTKHNLHRDENGQTSLQSTLIMLVFFTVASLLLFPPGTPNETNQLMRIVLFSGAAATIPTLIILVMPRLHGQSSKHLETQEVN